MAACVYTYTEARVPHVCNHLFILLARFDLFAWIVHYNMHGVRTFCVTTHETVSSR